jgi:hypothetical protein
MLISLRGNLQSNIHFTYSNVKSDLSIYSHHYQFISGLNSSNCFLPGNIIHSISSNLYPNQTSKIYVTSLIFSILPSRCVTVPRLRYCCPLYIFVYTQTHLLQIRHVCFGEVFAPFIADVVAV